MFHTLTKHLLTHCWCRKCHGQIPEQSFHFRVYVFERGRKNHQEYFWVRISEMESGRTVWHEEGMRADIMERRGPEDVVFLTMFDLFCSTSLEKYCEIISSGFRQLQQLKPHRTRRCARRENDCVWNFQLIKCFLCLLKHNWPKHELHLSTDSQFSSSLLHLGT